MNNGKLRIKVSTGSVDIELEGEPDTVIQQFEKIKENGLGAISLSMDSHHQRFLSVPTDVPKPATILSDPVIPLTDGQYENLSNVVKKALPRSETEWVLVFAFYASGFGDGKFSRDGIMAKYQESRRISKSTKGNLTNNLHSLLRNDNIKAISNTDYVMTTKGSRKAKMILGRKGP